ncbi:hypothetical protein ACXWN3_09425, partial [Streptococcus pyogenes]
KGKSGGPWSLPLGSRWWKPLEKAEEFAGESLKSSIWSLELRRERELEFAGVENEEIKVAT